MAVTVIVIVIVIVVVLLAAAAGIVLGRRRALERRFGPEYDRLAAEIGPRQARSELAERQRRIQQLHIRPLSAERRAAYEAQLTMLQEQFIDTPARAAAGADALVTAVAADRGYQVADRERLLADLSVYHADRIEDYRRARQATGQPGSAETEDLRQAMLAYRTLLLELFDAPDGASETAASESAPQPGDTDGTGTETGTGPEVTVRTGARAEADGPLDDRSA
jgi:hypothetical protein